MFPTGAPSTNLSKLTIGQPAPFSVPQGSPLVGGNYSLTPQAPGLSPAQSTFRASLQAPTPTSPLTNKPVTYGGAATVPGAVAAPAPVPVALPTGSITSADASGNVTGGSKFSIDTTSPVTSAHLASSYTPTDATQTRSQYEQYAQQLAGATQYSPQYLSDLNAANQSKLEAARLTSNLFTGTDLPGDTMQYAQGATAKAQAQNALEQMSATQRLAVDEQVRSGNIEAAKALVSAYAPQSVAPGSSLVSPTDGSQVYSGLGGYQAVQGIQTVNNLAQNFPDANISPGDSLQVAQQKAQTSPSFQSRSTIPVTLPGGGYALVNKNQVAGYRSDGTAIIVSPATAAQAQGAQQAIAGLTKDRADVQSAITTADQNFPMLLQAVQGAGLNNNAPLVNEITQKIANKTSQSTAMAALNVLIPSLQTEYSRIVARGGQVDDKTRNAANAIINGTYTFGQLQAVYNVVQKEGKNVLKGYDDEINRQSSQLNTLYNTNSPTGSSGSSSGGSLYDF